MAEIDIVYNQSIRQFDPLKIAGTNDSISESCDVLFNLRFSELHFPFHH